MQKEYGVCPICNGSGRKAVPAESQKYKNVMSGYDSGTDTVPCNNCGGQTMYGKPSGKVPLRNDGTPCVHEYDYQQLGRCYHGYTCKFCKYSFQIDSGD